MSTPQQGQHHDLFEIKILFREICDLLKKAGINLDGLFLNADRTDFYGLSKRASIIFVIFLLVMYHRTDSMDKFVANGIQD